MNEDWEENFKIIWEEIKKKDFKETKTNAEKMFNGWETWKKRIQDTNISWQQYYKPGKENNDNLVYFVYNNGSLGGIRLPKISHLFESQRDLNSEGLDSFMKDSKNTDKVKKYIKLFKICLEQEDVKKLDEEIKESNYHARNFIRKLIVLNSYSQKKDEYFCVYLDDAIKKLYEIFCDKKSYKPYIFFEANKEIFAAAKKIVQKDSTMEEFEYNIKLGWALWELVSNNNQMFPTTESPNVIFYGAPGTGKTYMVKNYLLAILGEKKFKTNVKWVQFHPSYTYEDFIDGIKPLGIKDNNIELCLVNGHFKDFCIKARDDSTNNYYFVADEINRANLSAVFGETLSLMEASYRDDIDGERNVINTQNSQLETNLISENQRKETEAYYFDKENGAKFGIPKNLFFIGMMNDVDKSIDSFDLALRRRFKWIHMDCDYDVIRQVLGDGLDDEPPCFKKKEVTEQYIRACKRLNYYISGVKLDKVPDDLYPSELISASLKLGKTYEFGHSNFLKISNICKNGKLEKSTYEELFNYYLQPTLNEYLRSFFNEDEIESKANLALQFFSDTYKQKA